MQTFSLFLRFLGGTGVAVTVLASLMCHVQGAPSIYAGTSYGGVMHSFCPSFDYNDQATVSVDNNGGVSVHVPNQGGGFDSQGSIAADGSVTGLYIQVYSQSRGNLKIPYTGSIGSDGVFTAAGRSGDIQLEVSAKRQNPQVAIYLDYSDDAFNDLQEGVGRDVVVRRYSLDSNYSAPLTITYKARGSAVAGKNYEKLSGQVTIPAGAYFTTFKIQAKQDGISDDTERLILKLVFRPTGLYDKYPRYTKAILEIGD